MSDWWRLCRDFYNVYKFFSISWKYSEFAKVRNNIIMMRTITFVQDLVILKDCVITITQSFWDHFEFDTKLNISLTNKDSKSKILQNSKK